MREPARNPVIVELLRTEGYGRVAEISVDGVRLTVVDGVSDARAPAAPGVVAQPRFEVVFVAPASWQRAVAANPERVCQLEPRWGWRYRGQGRVVGLEPLRLDFGALELEFALPADATRALGDCVSIEIDRIRLTGTAAPA